MTYQLNKISRSRPHFKDHPNKNRERSLFSKTARFFSNIEVTVIDYYHGILVSQAYFKEGGNHVAQIPFRLILHNQ